MSEYYITKSDCYVSHSGIPGMKWGIRRYQNEDGTLTPEGRIRYGKQAAKAYFKQDMLRRKQEKANDFKTYKKLGKKIRKAEERESVKEGKLSNEDKRHGRYSVAKFRNIKSHVESGVAGVGAGLTTSAFINSLASTTVVSFGADTVALGTSTINPLLGVGLIAATSGLSALATRVGTHGHYYKKQAEANAPVPSPVEETKKSSSSVKIKDAVGRYPYGSGAGAKKRSSQVGKSDKQLQAEASNLVRAVNDHPSKENLAILSKFLDENNVEISGVSYDGDSTTPSEIKLRNKSK